MGLENSLNFGGRKGTVVNGYFINKTLEKLHHTAITVASTNGETNIIIVDESCRWCGTGKRTVDIDIHDRAIISHGNMGVLIQGNRRIANHPEKRISFPNKAIHHATLIPSEEHAITGSIGATGKLSGNAANLHGGRFYPGINSNLISNVQACRIRNLDKIIPPIEAKSVVNYARGKGGPVEQRAVIAALDIKSIPITRPPTHQARWRLDTGHNCDREFLLAGFSLGIGDFHRKSERPVNCWGTADFACRRKAQTRR